MSRQAFTYIVKTHDGEDHFDNSLLLLSSNGKTSKLVTMDRKEKCMETSMSLYDVASLSNVPSLSTAVLNAMISLSNLSGLIAIFSLTAFFNFLYSSPE